LLPWSAGRAVSPFERALNGVTKLDGRGEYTRKLVVCNTMSLDGYLTGPDNNVMVLELDGAFDAYNVGRSGPDGAHWRRMIVGE
jgi:hypothetical protein